MSDKRKRAGTILFLILMGIYPFVMTNGYYNVTATKYCLFAVTTICISFYVILSGYSGRVVQEKGFHPRKANEIWKSFSATDKWMIVFLTSVVVSFLFAKKKNVAFTGSTDGHIGLYFMFLLLLLYVVAKKEIVLSKKLFFWMTLAADVVILFAMIQFLGADPFGILTNLKTDKINNYLSTFGNTGVYGQYLTLVVPVAIYNYCRPMQGKQNEKLPGFLEKVFYGISCGIGTIGVLISNTDATYLGFAVAAGLLLLLMIKEKASCLRFLESLAVEGVTALLFGRIYAACHSARPVSSMGRDAMNVKLCLFFIGMIVCLWLICRFLLQSEKCYRVLHVLAAVVTVVVVVTILGAFVYFSAIDRTTNIGRLDGYFRFSKEWGTQRGYVWTWLFQIFLDAPLFQKLFGAGQGSVVLELFTYHAKEMIYDLEYYFDNAHNVYLHYLTTIGIFGCVSYLGVLTSAVAKGIKREMSDAKKALLVPVVAYAIQDIFSILQPITLPLFFLYLAILAGCKEEKEVS
ncbi:MAG: O-antigen ligase family protein [Roseburia sp.]|nr:O-antigen ligase family protein [Roseburia sp.]